MSWAIISSSSGDGSNIGGVSAGFVVGLALLGAWGLSGGIGAAIGASKGRGWAGFFLGLFLGFIGWIIVAVMRPSLEIERQKTGAMAAAIATQLQPQAARPVTSTAPRALGLDSEVDYDTRGWTDDQFARVCVILNASDVPWEVVGDGLVIDKGHESIADWAIQQVTGELPFDATTPFPPPTLA